MSDRDYFSELKINKHRLDEEWENQSEKSMYWAKQAATAQSEFDKTNMERKILKARLGKQYRQEIENAGKKPTDKMIEEMIRTNPEYREATFQLIKDKEYLEIMDSAKWEFVSRKVSLEKIQQGIISGLFSDPRNSDPREEDRIRDAMADKRRRT